VKSHELAEEKLMRLGLFSASGILIAAAALLLSFSTCTAREVYPALAFLSFQTAQYESNYHKFDVRRSQSFFLFSLRYPGSRLNSRFSVYYPVSVAPAPDYRSLEERIADYLIPLLQYPGGALLCDAVQAGLEFLTYSRDITTYGYRKVHAGCEFNRTGFSRNFLRTGIFCSF